MLPRIRRLLDVRAGEGLRVLLSCLYVAVVVGAFLLAKPIRNSLFLAQHGPYSLVYVYAAVPVALSIFVPVYARIAARVGSRIVIVWTLVFFSSNVLLFWLGFRARAGAAAERGTLGWLLPGLFYVWVNCFGVIAPVQAWTFASSLFDSRQARRLFGLVGAGASFGAIAAGLMARFLVRPVGGTVNMMLVLAGLILAAAGIVAFATVRLRRPGAPRVRPAAQPFGESLAVMARNPYLRLLAALVFLVAISTQWTAFQLSLVAAARFGGRTDALTAFFGTFNFAMGAVALLVQLLLAGPLLRRFGVALGILLLPITLGAGSLLILLLPAFWPVLVTNACDQGLRFSLDKSAYELLYLPLAPAQRAPVKHAIDIVVSRVADAAGAVVLGCATRGFFFFHGLGLGLRGTAAVNLVMIGAWGAAAWRLRLEYVRAIQDSLHLHRLEVEGAGEGRAREHAPETLAARLSSADPAEVRGALDAIEPRRTSGLDAPLRRLLHHPAADVRRRALALLAASEGVGLAAEATRLMRDPDAGVRTEALLFATRELGVDPLVQLQALGEVEGFSIRAGLAAFLASPGPSQKLEAARVILEGMAADGAPDRAQAARVLGLVPDAFPDLLLRLLRDADPAVARDAVHALRDGTDDACVPALVEALSRPDLSADAAEALGHRGNRVVPELDRLIHDLEIPLAVRREIPVVLLRIGTPLAQRVLVDALLQPDATLRHRIVTSLNKLHEVHPEIAIDGALVELLLAAEIAGHYRSYQVLGPLRARQDDDSLIVTALRQAMEQELERIFRLMALRFEGPGLHDAYAGVRSSNPLVRANSLEFLENVLEPELRRVLVPLLDSHVSVEQRIAIADRLVGAPLESAEQAVATLLASEDAWLRSCAVHAVGALQLRGLEGELRALESSDDPAVRDAVRSARQRLSMVEDAEPPSAGPREIGMGVG